MKTNDIVNMPLHAATRVQHNSKLLSQHLNLLFGMPVLLECCGTAAALYNTNLCNQS
jgi:hypothetical protein